MVFSSSLFILYFLPTFLILYYLSPNRFRNLVALVASLFFYAWGAPDFIFIVLISIIADFYLVQMMYKATKRNRKRLFAALSVVMNVGLLAYFKYANFFIENVNALLNALGANQVSWTEVALPIGISFFTFQKMTYTIDVYRGLHPPLRRIGDLALYILMFPQLIAGPIVRFGEVAQQLNDRRWNETPDNRITGFFRFTIGLAKKVLIANPLGAYADAVFAADVAQLDQLTLWIGVLAYAFQIYYDFAGYSDMAIGLGRMIGFDFPENFNNPYISQSISEFWRRWHITLGRWMRDYLYIPLGGNRVSAGRMYFNLWLVFLISGLWHGAAWNFVIWGAFHGTFLILDRLFLLSFYKRIGKLPSMLITFFITLIGWVLFRADSMHQVGAYLGGMFGHGGQNHIQISREVWMTMAFGGFFAFVAFWPQVEQWQNKLFAKQKSTAALFAMALMSAILLVLCLGAITSSGFNPFIYFRF